MGLRVPLTHIYIICYGWKLPALGDVTTVVIFWSHLTTGEKVPVSSALICGWYGPVGLKHSVEFVYRWSVHGGNKSQ